MSVLFYGTIVVVQLAFSSAQQPGWMNQQVPVCAPVAGNPLQGTKGDRGVPGKRGMVGEKGEKGVQALQVIRGSSCSGITYHFSQTAQITDFVQYHGYVPTTDEMTMCAWLEPINFDRFSTVASYAIQSQTNELFVAVINPTTLRFVINANLIDITIASLSEVSKIHLCFWLSSKLRQAGYYINGEQQEIRSISSSTKIRGGGILILGQEQDSFGGGFDKNQNFRGNITNLMIWPRVLTRSEITRMIRHCDCPRHFSVEMSLDKIELHGQARYSLPEECPEL